MSVVGIINQSQLNTYNRITKEGDMVYVINQGLFVRDGKKGWIQSSILEATTALPTHALTDHSDVVIGTPAPNEALVYNGSNWVNGSTTLTALSFAGDVTYTPAPTAGTVLVWNTGTNDWRPGTIGSTHTLVSHSDVTFAVSPTSNQLLRYDTSGTSEWQNFSIDTSYIPEGTAYGSLNQWYTDAKVYGWSNTNVLGGTGISLVFNGTGYDIDCEIVYTSSLADTNIKDPVSGIGVEPSTGDVMTYIGTWSTGKWTPAAPTLPALDSVGGVVSSGSWVTNYFLQWTGSTWITADANTGATLRGLGDTTVTITDPSLHIGAMLYYAGATVGGGGGGVNDEKWYVGQTPVDDGFYYWDDTAEIVKNKLLTVGDLPDLTGTYLPIVAGSGNPLSGALHISSATDALIDIESTDANSYIRMADSGTTGGTNLVRRTNNSTYFYNNGSQFLEVVNVTGGNGLGINMSPLNNTTLAIESLASANNPLRIYNSLGAQILNFYETSGNDLIIRGYTGGGVQRIKIDTNGSSYLTGGSLGVGTNSPNYKIHVDSTTSDSIARFSSDKGSIVFLSQTGVTELRGRDSAGTSYQPLMVRGGTQYMYFAASGIGINDSSPSYDLDINGNFRSTGIVYADSGIRLNSNPSGTIEYNSSFAQIRFGGTDDIHFDITNSEGVADDWVARSDRIKKTNINYKDNWTDVVEAIGKCVVEYNWKSNPDGVKQIGFIAQDIKEIEPRFVSIGSSGVHGLSYQKMVAPLYSVVADLIYENKKLKREIEEIWQSLR